MVGGGELVGQFHDTGPRRVIVTIGSVTSAPARDPSPRAILPPALVLESVQAIRRGSRSCAIGSAGDDTPGPMSIPAYPFDQSSNPNARKPGCLSGMIREPPISDLAATTRFYEAIGCVKNPQFSDEKAVSMVWSEPSSSCC